MNERRSRGRPRKSWRDDLDIFMEDSNMFSSNRKVWVSMRVWPGLRPAVGQ